MATRIRFPSQVDYTCPCNLTGEPCDGSCSILDLSATSFVKPFGIALLYGLASWFREQDEEVEVLVPNDDVATYLWRMNLHRPFAADRGVRFVPNLGGILIHPVAEAQAAPRTHRSDRDQR